MRPCKAFSKKGIFMHNRKKIALFSICAVLFFIWLGVSNQVIATLANHKKDIKITRTSLPSDFGPNEIRYFLSDVRVEKDLTETLYIGGWAYSMSKASDRDTLYIIYLQSEKDVYAVLPSMYHLQDQSYLNELTGADKQLLTMRLEFSTVGMKNGTYRILIAAEEYGKPAGVAYTEYYLVKESAETKISLWQPTDQKITIQKALKEAPNAYVNLLRTEANQEGQVAIEGNILNFNLEASPTQNTSIYVIAQDSQGHTGTYPTQIMRSAEFGKTSQGQNLDLGFYTVLSAPFADLVTLKVIIEQGDQQFLAGQAHLFVTRDENTVYATAVKTVDLDISSAKPVQKDYAGITHIGRETDGTMHVVGWLANPSEIPDNTLPYVEVERKDASREIYVAQRTYHAMEDTALDQSHSGITAYIPKGEDVVSIRLFAVYPGSHVLHSPSYRTIPTPTGFYAVEIKKQTTVVQPQQQEPYGVNALFYKENVENDIYTFDGWAYTEDKDSSKQSYRLEVIYENQSKFYSLTQYKMNPTELPLHDMSGIIVSFYSSEKPLAVRVWATQGEEVGHSGWYLPTDEGEWHYNEEYTRAPV